MPSTRLGYAFVGVRFQSEQIADPGTRDAFRELIISLRAALQDIVKILNKENTGNSSLSPDGSGNATIAHGLPSTPTTALVGIRGDNVNSIDVESLDATNITVRVKDASGADVTAGTFTIDWFART